jgi:putative redox protein
MKETVETNWIGNMVFESDIEGYKIRLDADEKNGGTKQGPRPKHLILSALGGCTAMDVISILGKKQVAVKEFNISVTGDLTDEYPKYYRSIHVIFTLKGDNFENNDEVLTKVERSISLSWEKYCTVTALLNKSSEMSYEIILLNS